MSSGNRRPPTEHDVAAVRRFNRFYTRWVGALEKGHLGSEFPLPEVRVIYELAHRDDPTISDLKRELALDGGYVSRIVAKLLRSGLVQRTTSPSDGRRAHLRLTPQGRLAAADLERRAVGAVAQMLDPLSQDRRARLLTALRTAEQLIAGTDPLAARDSSYVLRSPEPGDLGWVVQRHGALYWQEYGWDNRFEGLVAGIVADFRKNFDERRERCWIAEHQGQNVGSVFLVRYPEREGVCKLRLLLVEPSARGLGIGQRLVDECLRFARGCGYHTMSLWTNSILHAARRIYEQRGFELVHEEPHQSFGADLVGQTWELSL